MMSEHLFVATLLVTAVCVPAGLLLWMSILSEQDIEEPTINSVLPDNL